MGFTEAKKKVLLADDDPMVVQTYQLEFELSGFLVVSTDNGQSAVKLAKESKPDVIFLDVLMPMMSGLEVVKRLKADPETAAIPVFILSNVGQEQAVEEALSAGAVDFILKYRFTPAEVVAKAKEALPHEPPGGL